MRPPRAEDLGTSLCTKTFTRSLAFDLGPAGIRVNAIAPGITMLPELAARVPYRVWAERAAERQALPGLPTPADIAASAAFLASDDARFITGTILSVDAGMSAANGLPDLS